MGGKQSKQAIDMSSPKYNIYDTFNNDNHNNMDTVNTNYEYINEYFYVYSVLMIIILVYNIILYTSIYLRRKMKSIYK
jgi:hypothetical protein